MEKDRLKISGQRLKEERKRLGMTQESFCEYMSYSSAKSISQLENGKIPLSKEDAATVAAASGAREQYLLGLDNYRTFDDMKKIDDAANAAALEYFKSLGFSFWPCYVWRATISGALFGYKLIKPYITCNSQLTLLHNNEIQDKNEIEKDFCNRIFDLSCKIDPSAYVRDWGTDDTVSFLFLLPDFDIKLPLFDGTNLSFSPQKELGLFELSENPLQNEIFFKAYMEMLEKYDGIKGFDNSIRNAMLSRKPPLSDKSAPIKTISGQHAITRTTLNGSFGNSSIELLYALSKNGIFQGFTTLDNMRRISNVIDGASAVAINSLFG